MRIRCPYCEQLFAVYPIPARQARQHRWAGYLAYLVQFAFAFVFFAVLGPNVIGVFVETIVRYTSDRIGMGLAGAALASPFLFIGLAAYDRLVPRFGRSVGEHLHCLKCGYILKGLSEPRCPECGERI